MAHNIYDSDTRFIVDPFTKVLSNISTQKSRLIQNDHNSEVITFELPRYIEGHDMSLCNVAQVHYVNTDAKSKDQSASIYEMEDLHIDPEDENKVLCSWLISHNATKYAGSLSFALRFACIEDGTVQYAWHTASYTGFTITEGVYIDGAPIIDNNIDIINQYITLIKNTIAQGSGPQGPKGDPYVLTEEDKAEIVAAVIREIGNGGESEGGVKQFTLSGFGHTSPNGDNTFNFDSGMTWAEWKNSAYNSFTYGHYEDGSKLKFETLNNGYATIDVGAYPDTPLEGICYKSGMPVMDDERILATTYYYRDLDSYDGSNTISFSIDGQSYIADDGMTFREWIESDYYSGSWQVVDTGDRTAIVNEMNDGVNLYPEDGYATADTIINEGQAYWSDSNW